MPPKKQDADSQRPSGVTKRKEPPQSSSRSQSGGGRDFKRARFDARKIITQTADAALNNGELDVQSFLRSREFEIKALQDGMERAKNSSTTRAFQQVPRDMRRRTASHNVKRVPKRLQKRAAKEMKDDNTPTVTPNKRRPGSSRGRLRAETAKRLGILAAKKEAAKVKSKEASGGIETRAARPKIRKDKLNDPPKPKSKFRKRQIHKTWLPTHMWHAKRATMTDSKEPLWRFALPITSTEKSYRPTHRASGARGAVVWDMSYMSTISLEGQALSVEKLLKAIGVHDQGLWEVKGTKWREGKRSWSGWLKREVKDKSILVCPSTIFWCPAPDLPSEAESKTQKPPPRRVFIRLHPSAFLEAWTEILRLSKLQRPAVRIEDLRFEIGSIELQGPGSTEALLGILHPYQQADGKIDSHSEAFNSLAGVTNPGCLPSSALLSFPIMDPRLHYPPRPCQPPKLTDEQANFELLKLLSSWSVDESKGSSDLFDRDARFKATRLPSQKSLNRRKALAPPGRYASLKSTDPQIPIILLASRATCGSAQGSWTLLAPWKCILPIWYGLVHYPLSSGGNPRFGGLRELRQVHFEQGVPWFPADFPGTKAGYVWETEKRVIRQKEWEKRPKGKRIEWDSLDLGGGRKGEIGDGWACDFEHLVGASTPTASDQFMEESKGSEKISSSSSGDGENPTEHLSKKEFSSLLSTPGPQLGRPSLAATILLTLVSRGVASPCARIYRLPKDTSSSPEQPSDQSSNHSTAPKTTRSQWLALLPRTTSTGKRLPDPKKAKLPTRIPLNTPLPQRVRLLAQSLFQDPPLPYPPLPNDDGHPLVPDEEDLIGFVTTGEFNLAQGKGVAVGTVLVKKVLEGLKSRKGKQEGRLCIVRNAGESIGRLAKWEAV